MTERSDVRRTVEGIECVCGDARIVVPAADVDQIIEYEVSPLPLSRKWVNGVGVHAGELIVSVSLAGRRAERGRVKGILLRGSAGVNARSAFEVDDVHALTTVHATRAVMAIDGGPRWVCGALRENGERLGWLDVPALLAELGVETAS